MKAAERLKAEADRLHREAEKRARDLAEETRYRKERAIAEVIDEARKLVNESLKGVQAQARFQTLRFEHETSDSEIHKALKDAVEVVLRDEEGFKDLSLSDEIVPAHEAKMSDDTDPIHFPSRLRTIVVFRW